MDRVSSLPPRILTRPIPIRNSPLSCFSPDPEAKHRTNVPNQTRKLLPYMHMSRLGSSESSMDTSNTINRRKLRQMTTAMNNKRKNGRLEEGGGGEEEGDPEVWETFNNSFRRVQSVLDRNRVLIQQVNENHQSRIPDNMVKNVALIQEINGNISKVVSLYSDLSTNFTGVYHQRNKNGDGGSRSGSEEA